MNRTVDQILRTIDSKISYAPSPVLDCTYVFYGKNRVGVILREGNEFVYHSTPPVPRLKTTSPVFNSLQDLKDYLEVV